MAVAYRVTIKDSQTGKVLWTRDYATQLAAMKYAKAAVRTNTKATWRRISAGQ